MPETELGLQILVGSIVKHYEQQLLCRKKKTQRAVNEQHKCGEVSRCCCRGLSVSCEEGSCCVSESVTQEKPESCQTPNITQALAATPVHTQRVALELCWYCLKSQPTEALNIPQLQVDSEDLTLPPSGERFNYQRDPRPHFGVAHSSRSVSFPLWDTDRPRELKRGEEEEEEAMDSVSCCPHCHLGLPRDTLRWHEVKCLLFDEQRNSSSS
ncbi:uncharacterized protein LOC120482881 [Pimephales promelas]|uniref:uncharacterized protein LOC120482881 n=1 Tax=Pimephales promelas TaxID=90988 RepID=UPI0019559742|nr:uncharacterized protein LOC120482881 [Pimephales promelas]